MIDKNKDDEHRRDDHDGKQEGRADSTNPPLGGGEPTPPLAIEDEDFTIEEDVKEEELPEVEVPAPDQPVAEVVPDGGAEPYPPEDAGPANPVEMDAPIWEGGSSGSATPPESGSLGTLSAPIFGDDEDDDGDDYVYDDDEDDDDEDDKQEDDDATKPDITLGGDPDDKGKKGNDNAPGRGADPIGGTKVKHADEAKGKPEKK